MTDGDREGASGEGFATEVSVETSKLLLVELLKLGFDHFLGVHDVLAEDVLGNDLIGVRSASAPI